MKVIIIGAGGHGRVVLEAMRAGGKYNVEGFIDADTSKAGTSVHGVAILGPVNLLAKLRKQGIEGVIVAIGENRVRRSYANEVEQAGLKLVTVIHPSAVVASTAQVGSNVFVNAGAQIGADAQIGDSAIINTSAVVDHDCSVGVAAHIAPGAVLAGRVSIGDGAFVGIGARVIPCMKIGANAVVGAGAVVIEDVMEDVTVIGVPARASPRTS